MKKTIQTTWIFTVLFICTAANSSAQQSTEPSDSPKETPFNTVSQTIDGKAYKLILIGDCLPQLFINTEKIGKSELPFYEDKIEALTKMINARQKQEWERLSALKEKVREQMMADIVTKKLVNGRGEVNSYYLTSHRLMVNGTLQDPDTFHFFRNKYIKSDDAVLYFER
jgi:hypothetical protein